MANREFQTIAGDPYLSQPWDAESYELRASVIEGVRKARQGHTPREMHEEWCHFKRAQGWTYGKVRDENARTHPNLLPYEELPSIQRVKDELFLAIAATLSQVGVTA